MFGPLTLRTVKVDVNDASAVKPGQRPQSPDYAGEVSSILIFHV